MRKPIGFIDVIGARGTGDFGHYGFPCRVNRRTETNIKLRGPRRGCESSTENKVAPCRKLNLPGSGAQKGDWQVGVIGLAEFVDHDRAREVEHQIRATGSNRKGICRH